jgi:hypothetical protein
MASIIRIKRSSSSGNPGTLGAGELAYSALTDNGSNGGDRLYIGIGAETSGNAANHFVIGGKYFTDLMDHTPGTLTASSAILVDSDKKIDNLKVDNLDLNGNTISSTDINGNIVLDPNGTGYVSIIGTNGVVIPVGTDAQRGPTVQGTIRYNTDSSSFEGYSGTTWGSLGGVKSVDGLTYITAESSPGASDDTLEFVTNGSTALTVDTDSLDIASKIATVNINANTTSTSTTTGALVVGGGVGVGGSLYVSGTISAQSATFASINNTPIGNTTPSTGAFTTLTANNAVTLTANTGSTSTTTGTLVVTGGVGVSENLFVGGNLQVNGNNIKMNGGTTAITFSGTGDVSVAGDLKVGGNDIKASDGTTVASLSDTTGNIAFAADVVVGGDLTVTGNDIKSSGGTTAITMSSSDVTIAGDLTVTGNDIKSSSATAISLSGSNVNVLGDLDVDVNLNVDGTAQIDGATTIGASGSRVATTVYGTAVSITGSDNSTFGIAATTASTVTQIIQATNSVGDANLDINVDDTASLDATVISLDATDSSNFSMSANSSSTKTLTIDASNAGTGAGNIAVGSSGTDNVTLRADTKTTVTGTGEVEVNSDTLVDINSGDTITIDATTSITETTGTKVLNADTVTIRGTEGSGDTAAVGITGSLDVDNIKLDGNTISTTDGSNTLYLDPNPIGSEGLVIIEGNLQVNGTQTTINSTTVTIDDPIFVLGGDSTPASDDNLDRGIEFKWHNGTDAKLGFFGYDDSASEFIFIADATDTGSLVSGDFGNAAFAKLRLTDTTASTTTSSGAFVVAGGVGIGGQLNVAGATNKFTATTTSTSTTTGAVVIGGGLGIGGAVFMGSNLIGAGAATSTLDGFNIDGGIY